MPTYKTPGVYIEELPSGSMPLAAASTSVPAFVGYTFKAPIDDPKDPQGLKPRMVTNWGQFVRHYGGFTQGALLPLAVRGFFKNGGGRCYIVRIQHRTMGRSPLALESDNTKPALEFVSLVEDEEVTVVVSEAAANPAKPDAPTTFDVAISRGDEPIESYKALANGLGDGTIVATLNSDSSLVEVLAHVAEDQMPSPVGNFELAAPAPETVESVSISGSTVLRTGVEGLAVAADVTMVVLPDLYTDALTDDGLIDESRVEDGRFEGIQKSLISYCTNEADRMAILDPPPGLTPQGVQEWSDRVGYDSMFATLYYPWVKVENPSGPKGNKTIHIPPSGHIAGVWARTDQNRGVWKAPANETLMDVLDVESQITHGEQEILNPDGINAIRAFGSRGIKVWGARTLSRTDPSWRYINVRRLFNMIETSIIDGTQWVVFEPNDQALWQRVTRTVNAFLLGLWRDGALFGASPEEAFSVKCDAETNPPESIDEGKLIIEVAIAPVKPAEFVIFRISQKTATSA